MYIAAAIITLCILWFLLAKSRRPLKQIPGPRPVPFFGNSLQIDPKCPRKTFLEWAEQFGECYKVRLLTNEILVVSSFDTIHEVLVTKGRQFADRFSNFRSKYMHEDLFSFGPADAKWKVLRQLSQRYLKQYGEGLSSLEHVITDVAADMFDVFKRNRDRPFDPRLTLRQTGLNTIAVLILGEKLSTDNPFMHKLLTLADEQIYLVAHTSVGFLLIDFIPLLIHLPLNASKRLKRWKQTEKEVWQEVKARQNNINMSFTKFLLEELKTSKDLAECSVSEADICSAIMILLIAGVNTTSYSFYGAINVLGLRQDIQEKIYTEVSKLSCTTNSHSILQEAHNMPYTRAMMLETLRYFTILPSSAPHRTTDEVVLTGYGVIPHGTHVVTNLWGLHHDKKFWGDPSVFRPERFLDDAGNVVPADHPNRKHLMPFGAGTRVCLGEMFAMARLTLWLIGLVQRFSIVPAPGNTSRWLDPYVHTEDIVLHPLPYEVEFIPR